MIIITKEEIINRIKEKYPNQPFEIIEYTRVTKPFVIKCLKCGEITRFSKFDNFISSSRKGLCACYNDKNALTRHKRNEKEILRLIEENNQEFINFGYRETTKKFLVTFKCPLC